MGIFGRFFGIFVRCVSVSRVLLFVKLINFVCIGVYMEWFYRGSVVSIVEVNMKIEFFLNFF